MVGMHKDQAYSASLKSELETLEQFSKNTPIAFTIIDPAQKKILWTSQYTNKLFFAEDPTDHHAHLWKELFRSEEGYNKIVTQLEKSGTIKGEERVFLNENGQMFVALIDLSKMELAEQTLILIDIWDITDRKQAEADVSYKAEIDSLLSNITSQLLDVNTQDAISDSLKNLGVYFEIDTISIQGIHHTGSLETQFISWSASDEIMDFDRLIGNVLSTYPWFEERLLAGKKVNVSSIDEIPEGAAAEHQMMNRNGIKSLLIVPILYDRNLISIITIECKHRYREWTSREIYVFTQYGNAIGSLIIRQQSEKNMLAAKVRAEKALAELEGAQDQLIRVEKMAALGDMVSGIAHETNTPLGIAVTTTSTLRANSNQLNKKLESGVMKKSDLLNFFELSKEGYMILENNLQRAAELIRSFKRIAVDVTSSNIQTITVAQYIADVLINIHPRTKKFKKINITINCPPELKTQTDAGALAQIIINLTFNALLHAYADDTGAIGNIVISAHEDEGNLIIAFVDDGLGLSDEIKAKIFEPYFTTKRDEGGSGLGMSIICNLVRKTLNGSIVVESELGKGTQFIMTFPMKIIPK